MCAKMFLSDLSSKTAGKRLKAFRRGREGGVRIVGLLQKGTSLVPGVHKSFKQILSSGHAVLKPVLKGRRPAIYHGSPHGSPLSVHMCNQGKSCNVRHPLSVWKIKLPLCAHLSTWLCWYHRTRLLVFTEVLACKFIRTPFSVHMRVRARSLLACPWAPCFIVLETFCRAACEESLQGWLPYQ